MRPSRSMLLGVLLAALCVPVPTRAAPDAAAAPPSPVIYDAESGLEALAAAHFSANMVALVAAKGLGALGIDTAVNVYGRQNAARFAGQEKTLPGLGCYVRAGRTQAKSQGERDSRLEAHFEYLCRGAVGTVTRVQAELALEAIVMLVDRFAEAANGIEGGGHEPLSVSFEIDGAGPPDGLDFYEEWVHVASPIWDTDAVT